MMSVIVNVCLKLCIHNVCMCVCLVPELSSSRFLDALIRLANLRYASLDRLSDRVTQCFTLGSYAAACVSVSVCLCLCICVCGFVDVLISMFVSFPLSHTPYNMYISRAFAS